MHHWVVAVKATFVIRDNGTLVLADEQLPPLLAPEHFGEPATSSVRYEADLGPMKPATEVLVNATAYAPHGKAQRSVVVSLQVNDRQKMLVVHGDRVYQETFAGGLEARQGVAFVRQPIRYEVAWGGTDMRSTEPSHHAHDSRNPIGRGFTLDAASLVGERAHVVEFPEGTDAHRGPAGFGAIASWWSPRRELAGTYDGAWVRTKRPLLPDDYNHRHTLCAPIDQQMEGYLRGGDTLELVNMTPNGVLRFTLPKHVFVFTTLVGRQRKEHRGHLVTVLVEPDDGRLLMTWQTSLSVDSAEGVYLDQTIIREERSIG
jgi:hypothetical protein